MRNYILTLFLVLIFAGNIFSQKGYHIQFQVKGLADTVVQLGYYFSDKHYIAAESKVDAKGKFEFKGDETLPGGLYMIILPGNEAFDLLLGSDQHFKIESDAQNFIENVKVSGDIENQLFYNYQQYMVPRMKRLTDLRKRTDAKLIPTDSTELAKNEMDLIIADAEVYWKDQVNKNKNTFFANLLTAMNGDASKGWDHIAFSDERLLRTPILYKSMQRILARNVNDIKPPHVIMADLNDFIKRASANQEVYKFVLSYFLNFFATYTKTGLNEVFHDIAYTYFLPDTVSWVPADEKKMIKERADIWVSASVGKIAPDFTMQTIKGDSLTLSKIKASYTLLFFWSPGCGHCANAADHMRKFFDTTDDYDIAVVSVFTKESKTDWESFITEHGIKNLSHHVWDAKNETNYRNTYYMVSTPVMYLLDAQKKILAARFGDEPIQQMLNELEAQKDKILKK